MCVRVCVCVSFQNRSLNKTSVSCFHYFITATPSPFLYILYIFFRTTLDRCSSWTPLKKGCHALRKPARPAVREGLGARSTRREGAAGGTSGAFNQYIFHTRDLKRLKVHQPCRMGKKWVRICLVTINAPWRTSVRVFLIQYFFYGKLKYYCF